MPENLSFFVKFHKELNPIRIICRDWNELVHTLDRLVKQHGEVYEWIIRD